MFRFFVDRMLSRYSRQYDYDVSYMRELYRISPRGFFKFSKLAGAAMHCERASKDAYYAAKLAGALAEDCGPCVQLVVNMAREAGVSKNQIKAVLVRDFSAMNKDVAIGVRFAEAIIRRTDDEDEAREAVKAKWGDAGVVDLTFGAQIGRVFPMVKAGLGYARTCTKVFVDAQPADVEKRAA